GEFMRIQVGVQTGNKKVFIMPKSRIPKGEENVFVPLLSDREMTSYSTPQRVKEYLFYPYSDGEILDENELKDKYPKTWEYLLQHKSKLESRAALKNSNKPWWDLDRPRIDYLMQPKIVSPHLAVMPRFAIDIEGKFAVDRSPVIYPKDRNLENDLLRYFVAVLNSSICYRYIAEYSHKYGSGYSMLEPKSLLKTPIPDPRKVSPSIMGRLLLLVDKRLFSSGSEIIDIETEINDIVSELYEFNEQERSTYGRSR
ncbi:MAG: TaqI-like C-terminal specificity domain-containing protein, partial [Pseudanabaena sp.]